MNGIDCATRLTSSSAQALKSSGVEVVGRYLGRTLSNGLTLDEVKTIHNVGLDLFLILELLPLKATYFTYDKGVSDAQFALQEAEYLGAPEGVCIYFTVDYEAQTSDMTAITDYLHGVYTVLTGKYLIGIYGSYAVMSAMKSASYPPDQYFQTYAWSDGKQFSGNHIYQYQNDIQIAGIQVDKDYVNEDAGLWSASGVVKESEDMLNMAVLLDTKEDFWAGYDVSVKNGNCALFVRPDGKSVPTEAMSAKQLIVVGGPKTGHPNEVFLSGNTKYDTATNVGKYLG